MNLDRPWTDKVGIIYEGYGALTDKLAAGLPIVLGTKVISIDYSSQSAITVTTSTGAKYQALKVLVTVPLGVLKKGVITFSPPLPSSFTNAMNLLGVGVLDHVFLQFPPGTLKALSPSLAAIDEFNKIPSNSSSNGHGFVELISLNHLRQQDIIFAEASASFAIAMESKSDATIIAELMKELNLIYPSLKPINYRITRWLHDPFAYGSYSYTGVGATGYGAATPTTYDLLAKPINNRVFFAGEHTCSEYPATVQGAYASGLTAATSMLA